MRRVCVAIGVSRAEGLLPLRAAAKAAEEIGNWARLSGFARAADVEVITDVVEPVTVERVAATLTRLLPIGLDTDTLLLHFAGHGLREDNTRTLWLPTNWRSSLRAIAVERLKNRLSDFGVSNVTIISDACKTLAVDRDTSDLTPDGVLGAGTSAGRRPIFDRFDAAHDVEAAFVVPGPSPDLSRCLFSGAVTEGLWGAEKARDRHHFGKVTPGSLSDYLQMRVADLCRTYRLDCTPQSAPGRPEDHLIYFDEANLDVTTVPAPIEWPAPVEMLPDQQPGPPLGIQHKSAFGDDDAPDDDRAIEADIVGGGSGDRSGGPSGGLEGAAIIGPARDLLDRWIRDISRHSRSGSRALSDRARARLLAQARSEVEGMVASERQTQRRKRTYSVLSSGAPLQVYASNLLLAGPGPCATAIWSSEPVTRTAEREWQAEVTASSRQLVVEYDDGVFVPLVAYSDFVTVAAHDGDVPGGWLFRSFQEEAHALDAAAEMIVRTQASELSPKDVDGIAALLRSRKHGNPVIGAICSYLYDYVGDVDSIRRMAFFYARRHQPMPYDLALLGGLDALSKAGVMVADVPAVLGRAAPPRSETVGLPSFVVQSTDRISGEVGGLCPWLRQGWDFLDDTVARTDYAVRKLLDVRRHLLSATFTALNYEGGRALTEGWGMTRWE